MSSDPTTRHDISSEAIGLTPIVGAPRTDLQSLAKQQGVAPVINLDELRGDFWPEDESIDEFLSALRTSRHDVTR